MQRALQSLGVAAALAAAAPARADDAPVEVTRSRLPPPIMLDVSVGFGPRFVDGERATGLALGANVGARIRPDLGVVAILQADGMAREDYVRYGTNTIGLGVRWDGPLQLTAGAGMAFGSSTQLTADYMVVSESMSGVAASLRAVRPLVTVGHGQLSVGGNLDLRAITGATITALSVGAAVTF
jgi:hypothetical protein